jgi:hypothetical protein
MPDTTANTQTTNSSEQATTGAAGGTAAPASPAAVTTTPAAPAAPAQSQARQPGKQKQGKGGGGNMIKIPAPAFKERIQREAQTLVQKQTGLPMSEVVKLIQQGGVRPDGGGRSAAQNTADAALKTARDEAEKLRKENARILREKQDADKKHKKETRRLNDRVIEAELSALARDAGIKQPRYIQFAISDFAAAVRKDPNLKPENFFSGLRATDPAFFQDAAPPAPAPTVPASTAPPESPAQGETRPSPAAPGTPTAGPNVEEMDDQEFNAHRKSVYGFTAGS